MVTVLLCSKLVVHACGAGRSFTVLRAYRSSRTYRLYNRSQANIAAGTYRRYSQAASVHDKCLLSCSRLN